MKVGSATLLILIGFVPLWHDAAQTTVQAQMQLPPSAVRRQPAWRSRTRPARPSQRYQTVRPARPRAGAPRAVYSRMPEEERIAIQSDLIWSGDFNGMANGDFGKTSVNAVKLFQKRHGFKATGILNPNERGKLAAAAEALKQRTAWQAVEDEATGTRLGIPLKLVPDRHTGDNGSHWQSRHGEIQIDTFRIAGPGVTLAKVFKQQKRTPRRRRVEYQVLRDGFFVLSGKQNLRKFYVRAQEKDGEVRGFAVLYDQAMDLTMDPVAVAMSNAFEAFPDGPVGDPTSRKVGYASGVVVSAAGDIVTDADATKDCEFIVVPRHGRAEKLGEAGGMALLRLYGARGLTPLALPTGAISAESADRATLVGVADPQAQDGGGAVSTASVKLASGADSFAITPAPQPGFSGAAAIDADGRLLGVVVSSRPQRVAGPAASGGARVIPGRAVLALLHRQGVAAAGGSIGAEAARAAVVRVICVRK